jgi:hypothetical protein
MLRAAGALVAAALLAACSQNAGFGAPPVPGPPAPAAQPGSQGTGPQGANASASPGAPSDSQLTIVSTTARFAYDGAEDDPVKAPRLIELAYALKNATTKAITVSKLSVGADAGVVVGDTKLDLTIPPDTTTDVKLVAFKSNKTDSYAKTVTMTFLDSAGKTIVTGTADMPPTDLPFVPLDEKDPKGGLSVDGVEISAVSVAGAGPHYEVTLAMTNAGAAKVDVDSFSVIAPKSAAVKVAIPMTIPARTTTGFISIIVPFKGKALPDGDYTVNAVNTSGTLAKSTGALL